MTIIDTVRRYAPHLFAAGVVVVGIVGAARADGVRVPELEVRRTFIDQHWAIHAPTADQVTFDLSTGGKGRVTRIGLFIQVTCH